MAHHASTHPRRILKKPREIGTANAIGHHERRHKTTEGVRGYIGAGATITGATVQTTATGGNPSNYYPGIVYDTNGLRAYNAGGTQTLNISAADGSITVYGSGTITGSTIQTSATNPRVVMDSSGIRSYDALGNNTFNLTGGALTVGGTSTITGGTIQTGTGNPRVIMDSSGLRAYNSGGTQTVNIGSDGSFSLVTTAASITLSATTGLSISSVTPAGSGARVVLTSGGIRGYNASNQQEFNLDATTGLITATGVITANQGSSVPWQTPGFFVGGGNILSNASAEDPTTTTQVLYMNMGTGVTAGTFTLRYGSNTITSSLNYNAAASDVQTALQAAGVLPAGFGVVCSGGPLPGSPITITLSNTQTPAPTVLSVATQSLTGGSAIVGPAPSNWSASSGVLDWIGYSSAFHGSQVFRLTSPGTAASMVQTDGPYGLVPGTSYTLSAYFQAPAANHPAQLTVTWQDASGNTVVTFTYTSTWTTTTSWQRAYTTQTVPAAGTRQQIAITGSPTGGTFTLAYNGQTTAAINYNASAAQVLSAIQALSNVGASGAAYATGGPLPGTPVVVSFVSPPASAPTASHMSFTNSLTGGTTPTPVVSNVPAVSIQSTIGISSPSSGQVFYVDAVQLEVGDAPTAFKPRSDEILANKVIANMINVNQLSAISANMGSITAGTITGATVQTASSGARVMMNSSGVFAYDASGNQTMALQGSTNSFTGTINSTGLTLTEESRTAFAIPTPNSSASWIAASDGLAHSYVQGAYNTNTLLHESLIIAGKVTSPQTTQYAYIEVATDEGSAAGNSRVAITFHYGPQNVTVLDDLGRSNYAFVDGARAQYFGQPARFYYGGANVAVTASTFTLVTLDSTSIAADNLTLQYPGSGNIQIANPGTYLVIVNVAFTPTTSGGSLTVYISKNGATGPHSSAYFGNLNTSQYMCMDFVQCSTGDTLQPAIFSTLAGHIAGGSSQQNFISIMRVA